MQTLTGKRSNANIAAMKNMMRVLKSMLDHPYTAQQYKKDYYTNYCTVSSWLYEMKNMPLDIDEIQLIAPGKRFENKTAGFFESAAFSFKHFMASFIYDYDSISKKGNNHTNMKLWINWGRDQAQVLNALIQDSFTPEQGVNVQVQVVNTTLIQGLLSGNQPDCALQMARSEPVNLAIRGGLYDLTNFDDLDETLERFMPNADVPYRLNGGCYALPDSQSFFMMFYRTDIFESLNLKLPRTWDEFAEVSAIIQRKNMQVGLPYTQITDMGIVNQGVGALNLFPTLLQQKGIPLYNDQWNATNLRSSEAIETFTYLTDFYTKLKFPISIDFYNRFRIGLMPLGIQPYPIYAILSMAAPEIKGKWAMAPIPGFMDENGKIVNKESAGGTGAAILEKSKYKKQAWEFIKWWTSDETQLRYSNNVEALLGVSGRFATSNVAAFSSMPWDGDGLKALKAQWAEVEELPEIPGGYYLSRAIDQAYWSVVNGRWSPHDALQKWSRTADKEIARKISEYGLTK